MVEENDDTKALLNVVVEGTTTLKALLNVVVEATTTSKTSSSEGEKQ